jgi:predicted porin
MDHQPLAFASLPLPRQRFSTNWEMQSGYVQGSRFGLKGSEDLGSGLQALFTLENGFDVNSGRLGQANRMFGRQAFIGGQSATFGTLTFGRQYDSVVDYLAPLTANGNWAGLLLAHPLDNDNTDDSFRVNNAVKFASNAYNGFSFGGLYGFSNQAGGFANNRAWSIGTQYVSGSVNVAASYMQIDNPRANNSGSLATDDTTFVAERQRVWGAGINYVAGNGTLGFVYTHTDLDKPTGAPAYVGSFAVIPDTLKFDNFELNAKYQFTPTFYAGAMYTYTEAKFNAPTGTSTPKWNQFGLMADYSLSKRTDVYVQGVYQKLSGGSTGTVLDTAYIPGADAPSSTTSQVMARVGLSHQF